MAQPLEDHWQLIRGHHVALLDDEHTAPQCFAIELRERSPCGRRVTFHREHDEHEIRRREKLLPHFRRTEAGQLDERKVAEKNERPLDFDHAVVAHFLA
jgi:hypothetical protein